MTTPKPEGAPKFKDKPLADSLYRFILLRPEGSDFLLGQWLQTLSKDELYRLGSAYKHVMSPNVDIDDSLFKEVTMIAIYAYIMESNDEEIEVSLDELQELVRKLSMAATIQCLNREGAVFLPSSPMSINPVVRDDIGFDPIALMERRSQFQEIPGFELFVAPAVESAFNASMSATRH